MKLIHCADLHLDSKLNSVFDRVRAAERRNEILLSFCRMVDYAAKEGISAILISGDLFDSGNVSAVTAGTVRSCIEKHPDIAFYYIKGNHDEDSMVPGLNRSLDNFYTFGEGWSRYSLGDLDRIHLYGAELSGNNAEFLSLLKPDEEYINLVMLHGQIGTDRDNNAENIDLRLLKNKGIDYLALGHIHAYDRGYLDERGIYCYCGCLEPRGFDEPGTHGFVVLDIDEEHHIVKDEFVPFATRQTEIVTVDVSKEESTAGVVSRIRQCLEGTVSADNLVKVQLTGAFNVEGEIDTDYIRQVFSGDYYAFRTEDKTTPFIDFEKYRLDESLKGEFVRLCMEQALSEETKAEILHLGLTAIFGGELK